MEKMQANMCFDVVFLYIIMVKGLLSEDLPYIIAKMLSSWLK